MAEPLGRAWFNGGSSTALCLAAVVQQAGPQDCLAPAARCPDSDVSLPAAGCGSTPRAPGQERASSSHHAAWPAARRSGTRSRLPGSAGTSGPRPESAAGQVTACPGRWSLRPVPQIGRVPEDVPLDSRPPYRVRSRSGRDMNGGGRWHKPRRMRTRLSDTGSRRPGKVGN